MAAYFFDTGALVKRHVTEAGTPWICSLTQPIAGHTIFLARITAVELTAAIARRQRGASLTPAQGGAILGHFRRQLSQRYSVVELTPNLLADAVFLARKHALRAYDAVQLAAMREVVSLYRNAGLAPVTLVSADRELNAAAITESLAVDDSTSHP